MGHRITGDHSRIAATDIRHEEKAVSAVTFLSADVARHKTFGITVEWVMIDKACC